MKHRNAVLIDHPIVQTKLSLLRDERTQSHTFRSLLSEISTLMTYELTKNLTVKEESIKTPLGTCQGQVIADPISVISILRSGLSMMEGIIRILPFAKIGHIGIYRDKFINNTVEYFFKIPKNQEGKRVILCDPVMATGETVLAAINRLKEYEVGPIQFLCLLSSSTALSKLEELHPDVTVYTASIEHELNSQGYLLPGVGDVGDRLFGFYEN